MRIGLVENPPWVVRNAGEPAGVEPELARQLAASLDAKPEWFWGAQQQHMEALERFELDLVIAGLDATTPWAKKIGLTRPYFEEEFAVGVPSGMQVPSGLGRLNVAVRSGDVTAAYLMKKHAVPLRVSDISHVNGPAAGPEWRLRSLGFTITGFRLLERKHVMAVAPGENGWLKRVGDFLQKRKSTVETLLDATERQQ